ncbi:MAG: hypothetical protein ACJARX_000561 [Psychroserpens sp.]|jgi:hypothetical protein
MSLITKKQNSITTFNKRLYITNNQFYRDKLKQQRANS